MTSFTRELVFLILQCLDEEKYEKTVHILEQESGFFFNMKYFEDQVLGGEWEEVERYLSGFTKLYHNPFSRKMFYEIRKQKYFEALDKKDRAKAVDILVTELKVFSSFNEKLYMDLSHLLTLDDFRQNKQLSAYGDTKSARRIMFTELTKLIEANPLLKNSRTFPALQKSRLKALLNQSLNWQHKFCSYPRPNPNIQTLFIDHTCGTQNVARAPPPANSPLVGEVPNREASPPLGPGSQPSASALQGWMANPKAPTPHAGISAGPAPLSPCNNPALLRKRPTNTSSLDYQSADSEHVMKRPTRGGQAVDYQSADSEHVMKRPRCGGQAVEDVTTQVYNAGNGSGPSDRHLNAYTADYLPKTVARILKEGSCITSMDFHPMHQTILLVGTSVGDIGIWKVGSGKRFERRTFKVWNITVCSMPTQAAIGEDATISVNRTVWSRDGNFLGVAFSKHIVHIYWYDGDNNLRQHLEIDAHVGGVNDLAFSEPNEQLHVITCGDDKTVKVWDALTGGKQYTFEGHEAPVYSVCPHQKESIHFIFSTSTDGNIKAWLYDLLGPRVNYDAPGQGCTTMAYSADGTRLFSCGTSEEGESFLVEWNENEGKIKHIYCGFRKQSPGVLQFDTTRNRFLAVGDDFLIKFWDMDITNVLTTVEADGGLPASPQLCFNKEGSLLAVSSADNGIKILANAEGKHLLRAFESLVFESQGGPPEPAVSKEPEVHTPAGASSASGLPVGEPRRPDKSRTTVSIAGPVMDGPSLIVGQIPSRDRRANGHNEIDNNRPKQAQNFRVREDRTERGKSWKLIEIANPSQCRSIRLPDTVSASKISRLIYANQGASLLALCSSGVHKLWKWAPNERNFSGHSTAAVRPQLLQFSSGTMMTNDINNTGTNPQEAAHSVALSSNDSYLMSASGGKVSIFNMRSFRIMTTLMSPPPAATFLAIYPRDNNMTAIGMEDGTIQIYDVKVDKVKRKLKGHLKRITGLAFSEVLNVLVSSGADAQLCVWGTDGWEKKNSRFIQTQPGRVQPPMGDTRMQLHNDQIRLLVVHESQLTIYDVVKLARIRQWVPQDSFPASISDATYSCDSLLVYAGFVDGSIGVLDADSLRPRCRLSALVHTPPGISGGARAYPLVMAAHPFDPNQFALGLSDGGVQVIEPLESERRWGGGRRSRNGTEAVANGQTV